MPPAQLAVTSIAAAAACALIAWAWIRFARARQIRDLPGFRRLHVIATPRGGGIAIAVVVSVAWAVLGVRGVDWALGVQASGVLAFSTLGLVDDLRPLKPQAKFIGQLLAGTLLVAPIAAGWGLPVILWLGLILACCYTVNVWNFMDGSNGLITTQALVISLALSLWPEQPLQLRLAAAALAGACLGFLPFNTPRACVFLGDVGSHAIGAAVFALLLLSWRAGSVSLVQALLLGSVVLLDSGLTLVRRALAGKPVWRAHREHLYQFAVRVGHSHGRVCLVYGAITALATLLALTAPYFRSSFVMWISFILCWVIASCVHLGLRQRWLTARKRRGQA